MTAYAHSHPDRPQSEWEPWVDHAAAVATGTANRAAAFGAADLGRITGWLHDLGKLKPPFQRKLAGEANDVSHSGEGARYAMQAYGPALGKIIAFVIAGHHSGLPNGDRVSPHRPPTPLTQRLDQAEALALPEGTALPPPTVPVLFQTIPRTELFPVQFFARMLFSALVDADFIETERFYTPDAPRLHDPDLTRLRDALAAHLGRFGPPVLPINHLRARILDHAGVQSALPPGFFSLTVPTGGGKTLTSLRFALDHALAHGLRRVIHVAPFTAIIEQTADVFRTALGDDDAVLEHHSGFDLDRQLPEDQAERMQLAAQNWDRPVVVTTAVQFYESLFANRTQKCRKLHNIARSVIVLDEAQSLPVMLLHPCLAALNELVARYGCSVVFCTATQPAIFREQGLALPEAPTRAATREIAPDVDGLFAALKRVRVSHAGALDNAQLVDRLRGRSALVVVNNKRHARDLFDLMRAEGVCHLTTNMTAAHRKAVLADIRARLADGLPTTAISTALIEAGVDISFPEVWRATAGVDSIAQSAGRCNREGRMQGLGQVYVFDPPEDYLPPPELSRNATIAREVMGRHDDVLSPAAITDYFARLYCDRQADLDSKRIMAGINASGNQLSFDFAEIAHSFRLIDDVTRPLIIGVGPWGLTAEARGLMTGCPHAGVIARAVQRFTVPVMPRVLTALIAAGDASFVRPDEFADQFAVLDNGTLYDAEAGFAATLSGVYDGFM